MPQIKNDSSKTLFIAIPPEIQNKIRTGSRLAVDKRKIIRVPGQQYSAVIKKSPSVTTKNADLQELFQGVYDAGLITNLNGEIIDANIRASQFLLYTKQELCECSIMDIVIGFTDQLIVTINENLQNDKFTLLIAQCLRKDGTHFPAEISSSRLRLSNKNYLCFFLRDITARRQQEEELIKAHLDLEREIAERTKINEQLLIENAERKRAEEELNKAIARLQEHDRSKSQFVSNVSHELKTPVASIMYMTGNLLRGVAGYIPEDAKEYLNMILEDCHRLSRTVDDILDMSRIEANTLSLTLVNLPFSDLVSHCAESMKIQAEAEGINLTCKIESKGRFVRIDPRKMERVIFNIVKNAIKYNVKDGSIEVILREDPKYPHQIVLDIIDTGIGIEKQYIPRVTERFFRVGEQVSGTGLGLPISKEILERHNGTLEIESPPPGRNCGTQVTVRLPIVSPSPLMIVYHDKNILADLTQKLVGTGYSVLIAENDENTITNIRQHQAELVILDWTSESMTGAMTIARIRNEQDLRNIPIVAITEANISPSKKEILDGFDIPRLPSDCKKENLCECMYSAIVNKKRLQRLSG